MTLTLSSIDELRGALESSIGPTQWLDVHQASIDAFAEATGDWQWIHVEQERAAAGPYGRTIAHGFLTLSLIPQFAAELFALDFGSARLNYGLNKVRFPSPVPVDTRIRASAKFTELVPVSAGLLLTTQYTIELENSAKPACIAEMLTLLVD